MRYGKCRSFPAKINIGPIEPIELTGLIKIIGFFVIVRGGVENRTYRIYIVSG